MRTVYCPYCGKQMEIGDQVISFYCMQCGKAIEYGKVGNDDSFTYNENIHNTKTDEARIIEAKLKHERYLHQKEEEKVDKNRALIIFLFCIALLLFLPMIYRIFNRILDAI